MKIKGLKVSESVLLMVLYLLTIFEVFNDQTRYFYYEFIRLLLLNPKISTKMLMALCCYMQELRKQLESQVVEIDTLRNENRALSEHHENVCFL